jgi:hypothetical protein
MESKKTTPEENDNIVKVAGKGIEVYNQVIMDKFQSNDTVELQVTEGYQDRVKYIAQLWEKIGFLPDNGLPIKFVEKKQEIVAKDKTTFNGTIYSITLKKPDIKYKPEKVVNLKIFKVKNEDNIVKIAGKNIEVYTQWILNKLQGNNQVELQVKKTYKKDAVYIVKQWMECLIFPESGLPLKFESKEVDIAKEGNITKEDILSITLTKLPEIFKYTKDY